MLRANADRDAVLDTRRVEQIAVQLAVEQGRGSMASDSLSAARLRAACAESSLALDELALKHGRRADRQKPDERADLEPDRLP